MKYIILKRKAQTLEARTEWVELTPSSFLFMILMATFSPVSRCRPSFTLAKPPGERRDDKKRKNQKSLTWNASFAHDP